MLRKTKVDPALDLEKLALSPACEGFSGADLKGLVQIATGISTRVRIRRSEEIRRNIMGPFFEEKRKVEDAAAAGGGAAADSASADGVGGATSELAAQEKAAEAAVLVAVNAECGAGTSPNFFSRPFEKMFVSFFTLIYIYTNYSYHYDSFSTGNWTVSWACFEEASRKQRRSITAEKLREYQAYKDNMRQALARVEAADDEAARAKEEEAHKRFALDELPEVGTAAGEVDYTADLYSSSDDEDEE